MNQSQTVSFLNELKKINTRDWLIAQTMLQGGKRSSEVLSLEINQICFQQATISFSQLKNRQTEKRIIITYPQKFMHSLREYIGLRRGLVFVTSSGKMVGLRQIARTFSQAGLQASIPFKITPHVLRATAVTEYKRLGCSDSDIMKVTGHATAKMIFAYDKSSREDNASKKMALIQSTKVFSRNKNAYNFNYITACSANIKQNFPQNMHKNISFALKKDRKLA